MSIFGKMKWTDFQPDPRIRIEDLLTDPDRGASFSVELDGMLFDYAKTTLTPQMRDRLVALADARGVTAKRDAMFSGARINATEGRAVLHTALRAGDDAAIAVEGEDVMAGVRAARARLARFSNEVRGGTFQAAAGPFTDVVNIGIGGSHLGPEMSVRALHPYCDGPRCHFVSNVDGADIADCLRSLDPTRTLVIVASKTFTTIETMTNAATARDWLAAAVPEPARQIAAVSSAFSAAARSAESRAISVVWLSAKSAVAAF